MRNWGIEPRNNAMRHGGMIQPQPAPPEWHKFLRAWRKSRKLTLGTLAERIGSKISTISGWETGRRAIDLGDLTVLAAFYDVHPAALLLAPEIAVSRVTRMQEAGSLAERMTDEAAREWMAIGRRMPKDIQ